MELDWEQEEPRDNVIAGTVGAFLGSLIGVACIVLVNQLGYVSAICGVVMAVCSIKGYTMLGGGFSKKGAVISGLLVLVMTYIANKLCFAIAVMEAFSDMGGIDFFTAYRSVNALLQDGELKRSYLGSLALLYLFTLLGGVPVIISAFRDPAGHAAAPEAAPAQEEAQSRLRAEFYSLQKNWMRPLRLSVGIPVMTMMAAVIVGWLGAASLWQINVSNPAVMGGFLSIILLFFLTLPTIMLCNSYHILYVRAGGKLWQVDLQKFCSMQNWDKLNPSRQAAIKREILQDIQLTLEGKGLRLDDLMHEAFGDAWPQQRPDAQASQGKGKTTLTFGGTRGRWGAVTMLEDLRVERETDWSWKVSYETESGRRKKLVIGKGYPGLCPAPGLEPPHGPVPCRWTAIPAALLLTAAMVAGGWAIGFYLDSREPVRRPEPEAQTDVQPEPEAARVPSRVPESIVEYELSEVWFQVDGDFQYGRRTFLDEETGTFYRVCVQYGVDGSDAWDTLSQYISEYRISPLYDRFDAVYLDADPLTPLTETSRYNIVSVYLTDGWVMHTAAVLSDDGTLFTMEAGHDLAAQSAEDVMANLMFTLESVRFAGPAVTEENYQSQIHISEVRDCTYTAAAYIRTDLFGHDAFVDVYVPYSESPVYSSGGREIQSETHGLRVYASILPGENAKDVIDAQQQTLAAAGRVYAEGIDDELYREDLDIACRLTVYEEDGQTRYAVLYADSKWDGYYLFREITGLPELVDEEYPAALAELEDIIGLTIPTLENLG